MFLPANSMLVKGITYGTLLLPLENIVFAAYVGFLPGVLYSFPVSVIASLFLSSVINHDSVRIRVVCHFVTSENVTWFMLCPDSKINI